MFEAHDTPRVTQYTMMIALLFAAAAVSTDAATLRKQSLRAVTSGSKLNEKMPLPKIIDMLRDIRNEAELNSKMNQRVYDRYGCWVERISREKTELIRQETKDIDEMKERILKLEASRGKSIAKVENTKQDIADNEDAQKDAEEQRMKERDEYEATTTENENAKGALAAAIKVLAGTGMGGAAFMELSKAEHTMQEVAVLSIVNRLQSAVNKGLESGFVSDNDLHTLQVFLQKPTDFLGRKKLSLSEAQIGQQNNPFGDYAPRSDVIQGILKQMLADFRAAIIKDDEEEAESAKAYDKLMSTRQKELVDLQEALEAEELALAKTKDELSITKTNLQETEQDLKNDKKFIEDTKKDQIIKDREWNTRVRLQAAEIKGIEEAMEILSSAKGVFRTSAETFLQVAAASKSQAKSQQTFKRLKQLATRSHSMKLAKIALQFKSGWHFDKVIESLDEVLKILREEEASDIAHKDRCENSQDANTNNIDDLTSEIEKTDLKLQTLKTHHKAAEEEIKELNSKITGIMKDMGEQLKDRNEEHDVFKKAQLDDIQAIMVIEKAIGVLSKAQKQRLSTVSFAGISSNNETELSNPEYAIEADQAPDAEFKSSSETLDGQARVIGILQMAKEDIEKDKMTTADEEGDAQAAFDKSTKEQRAEIANLDRRVATLTKQKADITSETADATEHKSMKKAELLDENKLKSTLASDCAWVKETFDQRYTARKAEMAGIEDAKEFLSGAA